MLIENTLENKAKFFAQYLFTGVIFKYQNINWGEVEYKEQILDLSTIQYLLSHTNIPEHYSNKVRNGFIEIKFLSSITDEDAKKVCVIFDVSYNNDPSNESHFDLEGALEWIEAFYEEPSGYYLDGYTGNQLLQASDYLRSKGYALPYMGLSVEQLFEYGWVKLKEVSNG